MKTNKKSKIELKKINISKLTDANITGIKGGNKNLEGCSNKTGILSLINENNDHGCVI